MEPQSVIALGTALAVVIGAILQGRRTRKTRPEMADVQVGYLEKINTSLYRRVREIEADCEDYKNGVASRDRRIAELEAELVELSRLAARGAREGGGAASLPPPDAHV